MNRSRVTGNLSSHGILFSDITNDRVGIGSTIPAAKLDVAGSVNVGDDLDVTDDLNIGGEFGMIGSSDANKYFDVRTGASNSLHIRSSLGGASNLVTMLSIGRNGSSFVGDLTLGDSSDSSSAAGPVFTLNRNSSSPADADYLGQIKFAGRSDTDVQRNYAKITGKILDASNGTEDGIIEFSHIKAGSQVITGRWRSDSLQLLNGTNFSVAGTSDFTGDATFNGGAGAISLAADSDIRFTNSSSWTGDVNGKIQLFNNTFYISGGTGGIIFREAGTSRWRIDGDGHFVPEQGDGTLDIGTNSVRVRNGYFDTLYGDGSNLTGITQTTINNNANNRVITGSNTANTLEAESGLLWDSVTLTVSGATNQKLILNGATHPYIHFYENSTAKAFIQWHADGYMRIKNDEDDATIRLKDNIQFSTDDSTFYTMWHAGNDGSGSGLDADLLDGVQASSFVRSDADDTMSEKLTFTQHGQTEFLKTPGNVTMHSVASGDGQLIIRNLGELRFENGSNWNYNEWAGIKFNTSTDVMYIGGPASNNFTNNGGAANIDVDFVGLNGSGLKKDGNTVWHAGNDGSGSGLDADTVDGIQGANFVRSDTSDTMSGTLSVDRIDVTGSHGISNDGWFRNSTSGEGLYNTATTQYFYSDDDDYWNIAGGTGANGLRFRDEHAGSIRGYVYCNSSNQIGFLNQSGNWTLRTTTVGITKLGSAGNGYQIKDGNVSNNLYILTGATGSASSGISVFNADGAWRFQLYGSSAHYGFLDANWNSWDIKKAPSGNFEVDEGSGLQRVWNAGNDGSGSGLDADTVDGIQGASFVRADASDTVTGAPWQLTNSGTGSWGFRLLNNTGTNNYVYFCHGTHGMHLRNDSAGTSQYLLEVYRSTAAYFKIRGGDCYTTLAGGMQITGTLSSARVHVGADSDIRLTNGNWTGDYSCKIQHHSNYLYIQGGSNGHIFRRHTGSNAWFINGDGHFFPGTNDAYDIGTSSNRVRNLYTTDLQLSNESKKDRGGNNVDGTWGDWTLQEGEDKIFMINNRTGKKYSLIMKEEN